MRVFFLTEVWRHAFLLPSVIVLGIMKPELVLASCKNLTFLSRNSQQIVLLKDIQRISLHRSTTCVLGQSCRYSVIDRSAPLESGAGFGAFFFETDNICDAMSVSVKTIQNPYGGVNSFSSLRNFPFLTRIRYSFPTELGSLAIVSNYYHWGLRERSQTLIEGSNISGASVNLGATFEEVELIEAHPQDSNIFEDKLDGKN